MMKSKSSKNNLKSTTKRTGTARSKSIIAFFPFLCIDKPLSFGDNTLNPSTRELLNNETKLVRAALYDLADCFRMHYEGKLSRWSYVIAHIRNNKELELLKQKLDMLTCILRYVTLSTLRKEAHFSHFNYFMLEVDSKLIGTQLNYKYFECRLNGIYTVGFGKSSSKVYKPYVLGHIETPFILYTDNIFNNEIYQKFYGNSNLIEKDKFLRAFEWFNRSFLDVQEVDESHAIIHLQTAFESLVKVSPDGIKAQLKAALFMLLGQSTELSDWINQFWRLRNGLVHGDVDIAPFWFRHGSGSREHIHHVLFARKVFVKCAGILLNLRANAESGSLHQELISNEVRLNRAGQLMKKKSPHIKDLSREINGLTQNDISASKTQVIKFGTAFLPLAIKQLQSEGRENLSQTLGQIKKSRSKKPTTIALKYQEALTEFQKTFFHSQNIYGDSTVYITMRFLAFAVWRLLTLYD